MSSQQQQIIVAPARVSNKLTIDSQQEQRRQQQQQEAQLAHQQRREQKRLRRQQAQLQQRRQKQQQQQKQQKYENPEVMFDQDSDDGIEFKRVVKKIKKTYGGAVDKYQQKDRRKQEFIQQDDQSDSDSQDDSQQSRKHDKKKIIQKRQKKPQEKRPVEKKKVQAPVIKKQKVKLESKSSSDRKQNLVRQVSVRWWYALPAWPPANYDYLPKLKQLGYRVLPIQRYKLQQQTVNGLQKVYPVQGYPGVFRSKTKLIDVRPKQSAPTLNNFGKMSVEELTNILRKALTVQIQQLKQVKYVQKDQEELLVQLERELIKLKLF